MTFEHGARRVSRRVDVVRNGVGVTTMRNEFVWHIRGERRNATGKRRFTSSDDN